MKLISAKKAAKIFKDEKRKEEIKLKKLKDKSIKKITRRVFKDLNAGTSTGVNISTSKVNIEDLVNLKQKLIDAGYECEIQAFPNDNILYMVADIPESLIRD